ncbi:MAG: histidine kinase [Bryobacterales bacterium]|nr:histidine kinase [Bryobacterales bacterium]
MTENVGSSPGLAARLIDALSAKQDELDRVARVLHENVGQVLTVVGLQLDVLRQDYASAGPGLAERVGEAQQLLEKAIVDVRELSYQLNPDIVPRSGLRYALDTLVGQMRESAQGATIRFLMDSHVHLPLPAAVAMYEITARSLSNAVEHSGASLIEVVLQPLPGCARLEVRDNGRGFDIEQVIKEPRGLGLLWIYHTARKNGITLQVESSQGKGTTIQAVYEEQPESPLGEAGDASVPDKRK